ncbi:MAG: AAA family ATPase, partial [Solirubrobacterales bacterium]|nr:AAA family ATPase [Solirubrobacterales bacterium]
TLREALGVSPSSDTETLYTLIVRGSPRTRPAVRRRRRGELPFMGRREELRALRSVLARPEGTAVLVVAGEPGIGKTRLVREALAETPPPRLAESKCFQLTTSVPYALLEDLGFGAEAPGRAVAATEGVGDVAGPGRDGHQLRLAGTLVERLSSQLPVMVFVDDLQWADGSSLKVLGIVLRRLAGQRLTVVATLREHEIPAGHPARHFLELAD